MSGGRGASKPPLTYEGTYDDTRTYVPREIVMHEGTAYMATQKQTGVTPGGGGGLTIPSWVPFGGGGAAGFVWADRAGITLSANGNPSVTSTSVFGFINAYLASAGTGSTSHTEDDYFLWDSGTPNKITVKQDGVYATELRVNFTPTAGAAMEFYLSSISTGGYAANLFPRWGPFFQPEATDPQDGDVFQTFAIKGGATLGFSIDAYHGPATGAHSQCDLSFLKIA